MSKEQDIQKEIIDYINCNGGRAFKQNQIGIWSEKGVPDIIFIYNKKFCAIEIKKKGNKPTVIQQRYLDLINKLGGFAKTIYSLAELKDMLEKLN